MGSQDGAGDRLKQPIRFKQPIKGDLPKVQQTCTANGDRTNSVESVAEKPLAIRSADPLPADWEALPLPEILQRAAQSPNGILCLQPDETEYFQTYAELLERAERVLKGLRELGLQPQDKVILQLSHSLDFVASFWGCILGGFVPVPIAVAPSYTSDNSKAGALQAGLQLIENPVVITNSEIQTAIAAFYDRLAPDQLTFNQPAQQPAARVRIVSIEALLDCDRDRTVHVGSLDDLALIMLTSGSTGVPKGVMLSGRNLLVSAYGMATVNRFSQETVTLNWMPLEHVASLVMFHFTEVYLGCQQVHGSNERVLQEPLKWLDWIERYRITATWAPNFAYGLVNDQADAIAQRQWDLSSIRWMGNGAEAVVGKTTRRFLKLLTPYGLAKTAVSPGYGMSETCSGIIHSHQFSLETTTDEEAFVEVGSPIPGVSIRIVDAAHDAAHDAGLQVVTEGVIGLLQVRGLTVTSGYYRRPELNQEIFTADGWFNTGDLGFLQAGRLTLTGRQKEVIVMNGVNYYNHDIEAIVEEVDGIEVAYTAACAVRRTGDTTDRLAIFFHPADAKEADAKEADEETLIDLIKLLRRLVMHKIGVNPDYLIPVERSAIPKTAIGKIQRRQLSQRFAAGEFDLILEQIQKRLQNRHPSSYSLPQTELERQLVQIWQTVLGIESVSTVDNFFELGGNSLRLIQVMQHLRSRLNRQLSVVELFRYPTIATLAHYLSQAQISDQISDQISGTTAAQQRAQRRNQRQNQQPDRQPGTQTDIAIIGMACRFPGADTIAEFWQNLCNGVESITFFSDAEILSSGVDPQLLSHPNYVKASPILREIEQFDAEFFGYSPREAELIDPQQRLLLECAWESLENAGYDPLTYGEAIGLYAGASMNTYLLNQVYPNRHRLDPQDNLQVVTLGSLGGFQMTVANDKDYLTTRVSYKLNLTGPSVNVQTACSTSLVAVHMAAQSLLNRECEMALAGGVSVHTPQQVGHLYQEGMILSPDGHCRVFDARAQGTIFGSGAGMVVLKRLEAAIADRDHIYAVIKGSAIGNDGSVKVGYLAPSADGQTTVAAEAMAVAGVAAETIRYVEAHGTGTELGDPIEITALTQAFRDSMTQYSMQDPSQDPLQQKLCAIGSVKTNVGHLNIASGVAGLIKTALALHHKKLPPSLHFEAPNPQIDFANSPFYVNTALSDWHYEGYPRRAGVNSLGIGGTNGHLILEEAPDGQEAGDQKSEVRRDRAVQLLALSAKCETALWQLAQQYEQFLAANPEISLADICFTAAVGRSHFEHRLAIVAESVTQLREQLTDFCAGQKITQQKAGSASRDRPQIAFLFTGQGCQSVNMGRQLYETQPIFRQTIDRCTEILRPHLDRSLLEILYPQKEFQQDSPQQATSLIHTTAYAQPALFALECALSELWKSWGIEPAAVLGHSVGEYVAAWAAGVFSLEDGLKLVAARGRLMQTMPAGAMAAVFAPEAQVMAAIAPCKEVAIAAFNSPEQIVISGHQEALQIAVATLAAQGIKTQHLRGSQAFHSPVMEPMITKFEQVARQVTYAPPRLTIIANLTGKIATAAIATPDYWCNHIRQPVQFAASMSTLYQLGYNGFVECGPKPILLGIGRANLEVLTAGRSGERSQSTAASGSAANGSLQAPEFLYLPSLHPDQSDWQQILHSLGQLYVRGVSVQWNTVDRQLSPRRIPLPTYPFQRQRHWLETTPTDAIQNLKSSRPAALSKTYAHPLLGNRIPSALQQILFESQLGPNAPAFLTDHQLHQTVVLPGTAYLEMALAAGAAVLKTSMPNPAIALQSAVIQNVVIQNVVIQQALILPDAETQTVQLILTKQPTGASFEIYSLSNQDAEAASWRLHSTGEIAVSPEKKSDPQCINLAQLQSRLTEARSPQIHYQDCDTRGIHYGSRFRAIEQLWRRDGEALGWIQLPKSLTAELSAYQFHPALLDACFQVIFAALPQTLAAHSYVPVSLDALRLYRDSESALWSYVQLRPADGKAVDGKAVDGKTVIADLSLFDPTGNLIAQIDGLTAKQVSAETLLGMPKQSWKQPWQDWLYEVEWRSVEPERPTIAQQHRKDPGSWLILADRGEIAQKLAALLESQQQHCILVLPGQTFDPTVEQTPEQAPEQTPEQAPEQAREHIYINPAQPDDFQRLLTAIAERQSPLRGVIHLWSLEASETPLLSSANLETAVQQGCRSALFLIQAIVKTAFSVPPQLWLVTRGAQSLNFDLSGADLSGIAQAPLWGMANAIALEHPELSCVRVDLEAKRHLDSQSQPQSPADEAQALFAELWIEDAETQVAFRNGGRYVARLVPHRFCPLASPSESPVDRSSPTLRLNSLHRGTLDQLAWQSMTRRSPESNQVEIQVYATGLNFRDVLNALDLYPNTPGLDDPGLLGLECAGEVVAVGQGVKGIAVGDAVVAIAPGSFSNYVTVEAALVAPKPGSLSFEQAATIPIAFLTAHYALHHLAQIAPGDRVLIHAAAGGVGLAAVQIAQQAGAEVFATASPDKWAFLQSLGVNQVMNSRSVEFAAAVMKTTAGQGVNIVLNSLSGPFIPASLSVLSRNGRFLEIGKQGVWQPEQVAQVRSDVSYSVVDLLQTTRQQPALIQSMLYHLMQQFQAGIAPAGSFLQSSEQPPLYQPLVHKVFPQHQAIEAFRYMQQAKHIGKIVITSESAIPESATPESVTSESDLQNPLTKQHNWHSKISSDGTYLITGGLGGLGLQVVQWLIEHGATHLLLLGRRAPSPSVQATLRGLEQSGAQIRVVQADVSNVDELAEKLAPYLQCPGPQSLDNQPSGAIAAQNSRPSNTRYPPLQGIIHAAGLIDDGSLLQQNWQRFERVMLPKVQGAWNLHQLTQHQPLDFFVLFSSAAALLGSAGQSNYAAANAFMDALAQARQAIGLPGLSINWGAWSQVGLAANHPLGDRLNSNGLGTIAPEQGLKVLDYLLCQFSPQVGVLPINVFRDSLYNERSFFGDLQRAGQIARRAESGVKSEQAADVLQQLQSAPVGDRAALLSAHICSQVAQVLGIAAALLTDPHQGFSELGMDSLTAIELRNRLQTSLDCLLPSTLLYDYPTLATLTDYLSETILGRAAPDHTANRNSQPQPETHAPVSIDLQQLSDEEAEALLLSELERLNF